MGKKEAKNGIVSYKQCNIFACLCIEAKYTTYIVNAILETATNIETT